MLTNKVLTLICFITIVSLNTSQAQWQPDIRLTNDPGNSVTSDNNARCIATSGSYVHIVWAENRDGNYEIYYNRSTDEGITWRDATRLTFNNATSLLPSISAEGPVVHVVFQDDRYGNTEIFYKSSPDAGISWSPDIRLTNFSGSSRNPAVTSNGSNIHVVWRDSRDGNYEIYYKRSTNLGVTWQTDTRLTNNFGDSYNPSIALSGSLVHIVWQDDQHGNCEIYYKRSLDGGNNWGNESRLTNNIGISYNPVVSVSSSVLHVLFRDSRDGEYDIFYLNSLDNGISWGSERRLTHNTADSLVFTVAASDTAVHMVWEDVRDGNYEIYYKRSIDEGATWETDTRLTNSPGFSFYAFVALSESAVHALWYDNRDGNNEIYYKRNLTDNIPITIQNPVTAKPDEFSLSQNYPNPFNPKTVIRYSLSENRFTELKVFDAQGREAATLVNETQNAGNYEIEFNGNNLPSGIYFYRISAGNFETVRRMILIK